MDEYDDEWAQPPRRRSDYGSGPRTVANMGTPRRGRQDRQQRDDLPLQGPLSMAEVEERIMRADDELVTLTENHMNLADQAAHAEADWKAHLSRVAVRIAHSGEKSASDTREASARTEIDPVTGRTGDDLYRTYKVTQAAAESSGRAMRSIEARLAAFQTIAANIRKVT